MAVTTTAFNNLLTRLRDTFPHITFTEAGQFRWSPSSQTVFFNRANNELATLLHETAHATLQHTGYDHDIDLIHLEREAWNKTMELGKRFGVQIDDETVENALDTYREWLHARSLCPTCQQNGVQATENTYLCVICGQKWTVNDARSCGLKRHKITK